MSLRKAAMTRVKNDGKFLKIWLKYYNYFFDEHDIYIIDNMTDDGSINEILKLYPKVNITQQFTKYSFDERENLKFVKDVFDNLLYSYDAVLYAEADEILAPNPYEYNIDLDVYIDKMLIQNEYIGAWGIDIVHDIDEESDLIFESTNILNQRKYFVKNHYYNKPLISRVPLDWEIGFHVFKDKNQAMLRDKNLLLLHLHRIDYEHCLYKHTIQAQYKWNPELDKRGISGHCKTIGKDFDEWFLTDKNRWERIPEGWYGII